MAAGANAIPASKRVTHGTIFPALQLPLLFILGFAAFSLLPRVRENPRLEWSFWGTALVLLALYVALLAEVARTGRVLHYRFEAHKAHYVQFVMQGMIYVYWGMYWREVYPFLPFIAAQILFVYSLDMLLSWLRRDDWILGFGALPIVLSTNLFIWFRDDWFFLQFALLTSGVLGKQFLRWHREGRLVHIFNPSAFSAFVVSVCLLATHTSNLTWGTEIATTVSRPPYIYLEIFLLGLIVQSLFSVTLVTLSAAATLLVLNLGYTHYTGVYHYIDSSIPVAVFIGLHLLITDPATSPRKGIGKLIFGVLYGLGIFFMYSWLRWTNQPTFYDKLLCVPLLNLMVPWLDGLSDKLAALRVSSLRFLKSDWAFNPQRYNLAHMAVWIVLFSGMTFSGFLAKGQAHPGGSIAFWQQACENGKWNSCKTWVHTLTVTCTFNYEGACFKAGDVLAEGAVVPRDMAMAANEFSRACSLGLSDGCRGLHALVRHGGRQALQTDCDKGNGESNGESCYTLGALFSDGNMGVSQDPERALAAYHQSCSFDFSSGCGRLGQSYVAGVGTPANSAKAIESFEKACRERDAASCADVGDMYRRGIGGRKNEALAVRRFQQACDLGLVSACQPSEAAVSSDSTTNP